MPRKPRAGTAATVSLNVRLTEDEHKAFSRAALLAGFRMPRTATHPEPRGSIGAWLRKLAEGELSK